MKLTKIHISDIGKVVTGKTPRTSVGENYGGNIPFLTPSDDLSHKSAPITTKTLTKQGLNEVKNCILPSCSVCVSCIGSDLGKVVMTTEPTVTNQQFNSIIPNKDFNADFVYYLMTLVGRELNYLSKTSTAVPIINKSTFSNYEVEVPDLEAQKKIASFLSSLDDKIELNRRINDNLEQQAQALFKSWFVDNKNKNWKSGKASEYYEISIGKTPPRKEPQWFSLNPNDFVWVSISDMGKCGVYINDSSEHLSKQALSKFNICIVPKNTVLLSFKLTIGRVAISERELVTNEAIAHFKTDKYYLPIYTYLALKAYNYANLGSTSSIATAINSKIIKNMDWIMPDESILIDFYKVVSPLFELIKNNCNESEYLSQIRDNLLPRLMSGELKINVLNC